MPVGMTLQQLYAPRNDQDSTIVGPASAPVPASPATVTPTPAADKANVHNNSSSSNKPRGRNKPSPSSQTNAGMPTSKYTPESPEGADFPQGRDENSIASMHLPPHPLQRMAYTEQQHPSALHQQFAHYGQLPPPPIQTYGGYGSQPTKQEPYGLADPLPFEYMGMRKFHENKDPQSDHRYGSAPSLVTDGVYHDSYGGHSPHPSVYESQHAHPSKNVEDHSRSSAYHQGYHLPDRSGFQPPSNFQQNSIYGPPPQSSAMQSMHAMPVHQSFAPASDASSSKKENTNPQQSFNNTADYSAPTLAPQGASQEAVIKVKTPLKTKYWRNGRRNLQCFPSCKIFGDYSAIKIEDLKQHDFMWGKCRGSIITEITLNSSVSFDDILILGRVHSLENLPVSFEEAVVRECMLGRMVEPEMMETMKDQWITGERLPDFVHQDANTACFEFKPKVWKYSEDMAQGKCKRRNVKYYVQFEAFVLVMSGERRYYACIGSGMSTAFEVGSSRVLARQKRKAAQTGPEPTSTAEMKQSPTNTYEMPMQHHPIMPHAMMAPHPMASQMFTASYPQQPTYGAPRGLAPAFPHPAMMGHMHHHHDAGASASLPPPPHFAGQVGTPNQSQQQLPTSVGSKRKMDSDAPTARARAPKSAKPSASM
ncbi:hypothetical protein P43SY_005761 [Pythium insidiosum]|uniref:Transmembrane protein n=1 Tax=Pythium insidiosum TaxID=114742 RepID=A0AAD5M9S2_PYTIN|nr:hypothetical protein P43SY_005761 [Pythium insidiosum]